MQSWADGLSGPALEEFKALRIADLMERPASAFLGRPFVTGLSKDKNRELAAGTVLFAHKPR